MSDCIACSIVIEGTVVIVLPCEEVGRSGVPILSVAQIMQCHGFSYK